jgi:putative DNA primase/helicase
VRAAVENYRSEEDTIGNFIDECLIEIEGISVAAKEVYQRYKTWAEESGEIVLSQTKFGKCLVEHGLKRSKTKGRQFYRDCHLIADEIPDEL